MRTTKKLLLVALSMIIAISIVLFSCNRYKGTRSSGIFEGEKEYVLPPLSGTGGGLQFLGYTLPANSLSQAEQNDFYDPEYNSIVLFNNGDVPALITSSNGTVLASCGVSNSDLKVKRSSDSGKTWTESKVTSSGSGACYFRPFFINCHNGDVLLGITCKSNNAGKITQFYRSTDHGQTWEHQTNINFTNVCAATKDCFVTFGQGLTLRHQLISNALMFPYFFYTNTLTVRNDGSMMMAMLSTDDGKTWTNATMAPGHGPYYKAYEPKLIELSNSSILYAREGGNTGNSTKCFYLKSDNCGSNWSDYDLNNVYDSGKHIDFTRYEFNGKPLTPFGGQTALMAVSMGGSYTVRITTNDFQSKSTAFCYDQDPFVEAENESDGYPAITVLMDGTIATLTEEGNGKIVFRRFNLYWLTNGEKGIDYSKNN